jgi:hypothetical protein
MAKNIEEKIVFGLSRDFAGRTLLLLGIPAGAWEYMKDGKTNQFDLSSVGVPIQVIVYGGATHDEVKGAIDKHNASVGLPAVDLRREDLSIKPAGESGGR